MKSGKVKMINMVLVTGIIVIFSSILYTNIFHYNYKMNADIASEAILARVIGESREWIPDCWYLSTELRILGTPNLASLFYSVNQNMTMAMGIACTIMTLGICFAGYFFAAQCQFTITGRLAFVLMCLIIPNHYITLELFYLWAGYYAIHMIVLFVTLGEYACVLQNRNLAVRDYLLMGVSLILSFVMGMQGTRSILVLSGPLFVLECIRMLYERYIRKLKITVKEKVIFVWSILLLVSGYIGMKVIDTASMDISRNIRNGFRKFIEIVFPDMMKAIGLTEGNLWIRIFLLGAMALAVVSMMKIIWKICHREEVQPDEWVLFLLVLSPCMTAVFVSFTTIASSERYYFLLLYALAFAIALRIKESKKNVEKAVPVILVLVWSICIFGTLYLPVWKTDHYEEKEEYQVVAYLEEQGYTQAYATFESANTMTVLSGGSIRVAAVASVEKMDMCKWLSCEKWYVPSLPYEMKTAYIVTEAEQPQFEEFLKDHADTVIFDTKIGKFSIYVSNYNYSKL